jgi:hypothetical protein
MKKYIFFLFIFHPFLNNLYGQFSLSTEYQYIRLINQQVKPDLIQDNHRNAEWALRPYLFSDSATNEFVVPLLSQLAYSYFLVENFPMSLWYINLKLHLYPDAPILDFEKKLAEANIHKLKIYGKTKNLFEPKKEKNRKQQHYNALQDALQWELYPLFPQLLVHADFLAQINMQKLPQWLDNWIFLNKIKLKSEYQLPLISFTLVEGNNKDIFQTKASDEKKLMLKKSFDYFIENMQYEEAKFVIDILNTCPGKIAGLKKRWTKKLNRKTKKTTSLHTIN